MIFGLLRLYYGTRSYKAIETRQISLAEAVTANLMCEDKDLYFRVQPISRVPKGEKGTKKCNMNDKDYRIFFFLLWYKTSNSLLQNMKHQ